MGEGLDMEGMWMDEGRDLDETWMGEGRRGAVERGT